MLNCAEVMTKTAKHAAVFTSSMIKFTPIHTHTHTSRPNHSTNNKRPYLYFHITNNYTNKNSGQHNLNHTPTWKNTQWKLQVSEYGFEISFANPNLLFPTLFLGTNNVL